MVLSWQNIDIIKYFLPLDFGNSYVILGMRWLETPRVMQVKWNESTVKLKTGGVAIALNGDPSLSQSLVSLKALMFIRNKGKSCLLS